MKNQNKWPSLPYNSWKDTLDTLHMWMQAVGKVKLALHPFINHWWQVAFYMTSSGMTTGLIPYKDEVFDINFDFIHHNLIIHKIDDQIKTIPFFSRSVADFYSEFMKAINQMGISVQINTVPSEFTDPIAFDKDTIHRTYDSKYVYDWWQLLVHCTIILERFRTSFRGKSSPVQFFWGSFDLNATRYSGKPAIPPDYGGRIMRFAENEENFSFGFWPGDKRFPSPAFYSYLYPAPKGIETASVRPEGAGFNTGLGEFILPYESVYNKPSPENLIMDFLQSTYEASARLAGWDIKLFEGLVPF